MALRKRLQDDHALFTKIRAAHKRRSDSELDPLIRKLEESKINVFGYVGGGMGRSSMMLSEGAVSGGMSSVAAQLASSSSSSSSSLQVPSSAAAAAAEHDQFEDIRDAIRWFERVTKLRAALRAACEVKRVTEIRKLVDEDAKQCGISGDKRFVIG
jgi:hypothetical protein